MDGRYYCLINFNLVDKTSNVILEILESNVNLGNCNKRQKFLSDIFVNKN